MKDSANIHQKINLDLKVSFCDFYKLDSKKPIVCIFSNNIIDGIFSNEWSIFKDNMTWLKSLIKEIKLIEDVNWLIKSHPSEKSLSQDDTYIGCNKLSRI